MRNTSIVRKFALSILSIVAITYASNTFAKAVDMYLEIKDEKGKVTKVPVASDGSFTCPAMKAGTYSFSWGTGRGISSPMGGSADRSASSSSGSTASGITIKPEKIEMSYEVKSPRDIASGQASGKRMHKPMTIVKEIDKSSPLLRCALGQIVLDEDCDGIAGKIHWQGKDGKTMAMDDWTM